MDLNHLLVWLVSISCLSLLIRSTRLPGGENRGWILVSGSILTVTALLGWLNFYTAGWIGGSLWAIFIVLPVLIMQQMSRLIFQERYGRARRLAAILRWLHPADGYWEQPQLLQALDLGQRGEMERASAILNRYRDTNSSLGRAAKALLYRMDNRWAELLMWMQSSIPSQQLSQSPTLLSLYLRGLGETGDLNGLLREWERWKDNLENSGNLGTLNLVRMFVLAFSGRTEEVQKLFDRSLHNYSGNTRQFWLATANMAAGNRALAEQQLLALRDPHNIPLNNAITWRLSHPDINADRVLTETSKQIVDRAVAESYQDDRYAGALAFSNKKAYVTYGIICLNLLVFALEKTSGVSESFDDNKNIEILYRLGALVPEAVWQGGEWWRLLTATFLHYGWLHLSLNMLGLYFLGGFVESALGIWRYLLAYLVSGVGSMLIITLVAVVAPPQEPQIVVGASGAIMGMVGVMTAILLQGWRKERSRLAAKRLRAVLFIIGLQIVFDVFTPHVSGLGHLSGLILGFLTASLLQLNWKK
jgi:rhomboid protease GluP